MAIGDDHELNAFVALLARRCEDPDERAAIAPGGARSACAAPPPRRASRRRPRMRIEKGAVTERTVREAAAAGARLVLGAAGGADPDGARQRAQHWE